MELIRKFFELCNKSASVRIGVPIIMSLAMGLISMRLIRSPLLDLIIAIIFYSIFIYFTVIYAKRYN
jgi:hypothetical protein